jgi:hypothetical protein
LIVSLTFPFLVISEGKEEDNTDHDAKDIAATADVNDDEEENNDNNNDDNDDNNNNSTMPPKVKPMTAAALKTAKKKT